MFRRPGKLAQQPAQTAPRTPIILDPAIDPSLNSLCKNTRDYVMMFTRSANLAQLVEQLNLPKWRAASILPEVSDSHSKQIMRFPVKIFGRIYCLTTVINQFGKPNDPTKFIEPDSGTEFQLDQVMSCRDLIIQYQDKVKTTTAIQQLLSADDKPAISAQVSQFSHLFESLPAFSSIIKHLGYSEDAIEALDICSLATCEVINYPIEIYGATYDVEDLACFKKQGQNFIHPVSREMFRPDQVACNYSLYEKYLKELESKPLKSSPTIRAEATPSPSAPPLPSATPDPAKRRALKAQERQPIPSVPPAPARRRAPRAQESQPTPSAPPAQAEDFLQPAPAPMLSRPVVPAPMHIHPVEPAPTAPVAKMGFIARKREQKAAKKEAEHQRWLASHPPLDRRKY